MHRVPPLMMTIIMLVGAAGCSGSQQPERSATCGALQTAIESAQRESEVAISELSTDPDAASDRVEAVRESLDAATGEVAADERAFLTQADVATQKLGRQARNSATGRAVDGAVVGKVRSDLLQIVQDIRTNC